MATGDVLTIAHLRFRLTTETESARVQEEAECSTSLIDPLVLDELDQRPESGVGSEVSK
jgi:hypothetical protein